MKVFYNFIKEIRNFGILWLPQAFSSLGSSMTNFALILFDLFTFLAAFLSLLFLIEIPEISSKAKRTETVFRSVGEVLGYLKENRGILDMILCMACINLIASTYEAALPPMVLSRAGGGKIALGLVNGAVGAATLCGSVIASLYPAPKSRVRVFFNVLLLSMSAENFLLAFGRTVPVWCLGAVLGWIAIPVMQANMDVLLRSHIPVTMQGRVYSARNTLQFFTIPVGYFLGGFLVDYVFEPFMAAQKSGSLLLLIFGEGKGSGAALLFFVIVIPGILVCLMFRQDRNIWNLE